MNRQGKAYNIGIVQCYVTDVTAKRFSALRRGAGGNRVVRGGEWRGEPGARGRSASIPSRAPAPIARAAPSAPHCYFTRRNLPVPVPKKDRDQKY
ncbi:unnamed protein product [Parnassius apollo]|uniref:(apollo) hypothetical protein n=1 Tax=Parnassius apollo TaxID=110799 RepID=A0A8S3WYJ0_PARAO|nr:unnamed protein product [Parnassius apollo]